MGASTTHQGKLLNCTGSEKLSPSRPCCTPSLKGDSISALRAILHPVENGRKGTGMFCWKLVQMMIGIFCLYITHSKNMDAVHIGRFFSLDPHRNVCLRLCEAATAKPEAAAASKHVDRGYHMDHMDMSILL